MLFGPQTLKTYLGRSQAGGQRFTLEVNNISHRKNHGSVVNGCSDSGNQLSECLYSRNIWRGKSILCGIAPNRT